MQKLIILALIGLFAQLVDGSLGMAYGVTSTTLLLLFGIAPAAASASVHLAEVVTTAASGVSHLRFGNVDKKIALTLMLPGSIGAFVGACFLSSLPGDLVKPYISVFLLSLGIFVMYKFLFKHKPGQEKDEQNIPAKKLIPLGLIAGFADSTGGGGWGPITTPVLLMQRGAKTRKVIGSVDTSEFAVAVSATLGFLISLGFEQMIWPWVFALMAGGIVAAPLAAWIVKKVPSHILGVLVGGLIIFTNLRTLLHSFGFLSGTAITAAYLALLPFWIGAIAFSIIRNRKDSAFF